MRKTEVPILNLSWKEALPSSFFNCNFGLFREDNQVHDIPDVMQQSCQISLFRTAEPHRAGELARGEGASQGMLPENHGVESVGAARHHPPQSARDSDIARARDSQSSYSTANRICAGTTGVERGIRHAQTLHRQRFIVADDLRYSKQVYVVGRLVEFVQQRLQHGRNAGDQAVRQRIISTISQHKLGAVLRSKKASYSRAVRVPERDRGKFWQKFH